MGGLAGKSIFGARGISFIGVMGALGNVLSAISIMMAPINEQVAFDFSHVATFVAAIYGGPVVGALTGFIGGFAPAVLFGYVTGQLGIFGFTIPFGKALTGFVVGLLALVFKPFKRSYSSPSVILSVLLGYVPEAIYTIYIFQALIPFFVPAMAFLALYLTPILIKGWFEMIILAFFMAALCGNQGFTSFVRKFFPKR